MEAVRAILTCTITNDIPDDPCDLNCGHVFELDSILTWYRMHYPHARCPNCTANILNVPRSNPTLRRICLALRTQTQSIQTQTDVAMGDIIEIPAGSVDAVRQQLSTVNEEMITEPMSPPPVAAAAAFSGDDSIFTVLRLNGYRQDRNVRSSDAPTPFVYTSDEDDYDFSLLSAIDQQYIGRSGLADLHNALYNPFSSTPRIAPVVDRTNANYIHARFPNAKAYLWAPYRKYVFQHRGGLVTVARVLMHKGYFIYDLFETPNAGNDGLKSYIVYSFDVDSAGKPVTLSELRRR